MLGTFLSFYLLENSDSTKNFSNSTYSNFQRLHGALVETFEMEIGTCSGVSPNHAPPNGEREQKNGVAKFAIVVSN